MEPQKKQERDLRIRKRGCARCGLRGLPIECYRTHRIEGMLCSFCHTIVSVRPPDDVPAALAEVAAALAAPRRNLETRPDNDLRQQGPPQSL